jgi:hypothetical protein
MAGTPAKDGANPDLQQIPSWSGFLLALPFALDDF